MTAKEYAQLKNKARFGVKKVNYPYVDYLFDRYSVYVSEKFLKIQNLSCRLSSGFTSEISWLVGG